MHEIRIAEVLSGIVFEAAEKEKLKKVTAVNVAFGQMVQIAPDVFRFAFAAAVQGTSLEGAVIDIEVLPVKIRCNSCGNVFQMNENFFSCSACRSTDLELLQGKELFIKSIEGE